MTLKITANRASATMMSRIAVTTAEVRAAAAEFLAPRGRTLALVSPRGSDRGLVELLAA